MKFFSKNAKNRQSAALQFSLNFILIMPVLANCTIASSQTGPYRPITIDDDVAWLRYQIEYDIMNFSQAPLRDRAALRNEIVTARMYIADLEYHYYEANLTREMQSEGLLATTTSLGLTTTASRIPVAQTSRLLSGIATGVTGLDKAYSEKELLSNTMQALQTQMRADRKTQKAVIQASMINPSTKKITPIEEYTLPMALSDVDSYYQAGTIASALIGLSKTVANAETNAQQAQANTGPNPDAVSQARSTAHQTAPTVVPTVIRDVNTPLGQPFVAPITKGDTRLTDFEERTTKKTWKSVLNTLCITQGDDLGPAGSEARRQLSKFLSAHKKTPSDRLTPGSWVDFRALQTQKIRNCP